MDSRTHSIAAISRHSSPGAPGLIIRVSVVRAHPGEP